MKTAFGRWLEKRGESHFAYAVRVGMNRTRVALLAGVSREPRIITRWHMPSLTVISKETGISIARLIEDATKAAANPRPPRVYVKNSDPGEAAERYRILRARYRLPRNPTSEEFRDIKIAAEAAEKEEAEKEEAKWKTARQRADA